MTGPKNNPIRRIIISVSVLLIISSVFVIGLIFLQTRRLNESASKFQLERSVLKVNSEFDLYFTPIGNAITLLTEWGKTGLFEARQEENIIAKLQPLYDNFDIIEYISIASEDGYFLVLSKSDDLIITKQTNSFKDSTWTIKQWSDDLVQVGHGIVELLPNTKSSISQIFSEEMMEDTVINSPVRYFYETGDIGINYGRYYRSRQSEKKYRISIGVRLNDIAEWIDSQRIGNKGRVLLFDLKGRIFRPQKIDTDLDEIQDSLYLTELDSTIQTLEFVAIKHWRESSIGKEDNFRFRFNNENWWAGMIPLNPDRNQYGLWLGVIVPEKDLLDYMHGKKGFVIIGFLIVLVVSIITISIIIIRSGKNDASGTSPFDELENEANLMKMIDRGESEKLEFKSTVRQNLHIGKPGKEIEIAWLKGVSAFLNSDGGVLLIGVNDDGDIIGLDADNFANDDRCLLHIQNLIKQHIGLEFSPYIAIRIHTFDTGKIVIVSCSPSKVPVFLKDNDKEHFFVRSGPSSVALPVSKALKYIEDRKKNN